MLFVIIMDMLNRLFVNTNADGVLQPSGLLPTIYQYQTPLQHYADDDILLVAPTIREARVLIRLEDLWKC
jgi:hypothetical protein